ncbi:MAG TPA: PIN domain-containing protein [Xanthobacteraceae bacterium]|nr:PIN domain-containing protein [Xanthobacteraceae bacterium]
MRIYWDANVFIRMVEGTDAVSSRLDAMLDPAAMTFDIVTSELTLAELLVEPLRAGDRLRIAAYETLLTTHEAINVVSVDRPILTGAAHIRAAHSSTKLPDAIHIATAELAGCQIVLSADRRLPLRPALRRVSPDLTALNELFD